MDQRGAVTDRLADVIRIALLAHKTGVLMVERDGDAGLEEGKIVFEQGCVTDATTRQMRGPEAFRWLNSWGTCRFIFLPLSSSPSQLNPNPPPSLSLPVSASGAARYTDPQLSSARASAAPYRKRDINDVLPKFDLMGLRRAHRQLFLLIDGQRSIPELIRLSVRDAKEVHQLLADLERAGLIQQ